VPQGRELEPEGEAAPDTRGATTGVLAIFKDRHAMIAALRTVRGSSFRRIDTYSPVRLREAEAILGRGPSPVRFWTLAGALTGFAGGFALAIGSALVNGLIVGGKHPISLVPYCIVGFEGTILLGTLGNLTGVLVNSRLGRPQLPPEYDARFSSDCYGIFVACKAAELPAAERVLAAVKPDEVRTICPAM
jgi:molybdopterin-containing oxidoreductase family membrane subunit